MRYTAGLAKIVTFGCLILASLSSKSALAESKCDAFPLITWSNKSYDRQVGSNTYLLFGVASLEAYGFDADKDKDIYFRVREYGKPNIWEKKTSIEDSTGMYADVYYHPSDQYLDVLIAFRGTRATSIRDWYSNFSPVTRWLSFSNAYDSAREKIPAVIKQAEKDAGARTVRFVATGHSLGGGLAQHVAHMFSCFSAVTFDSSCVINSAGSKFEPKVVNVYETGDELTRFCKFGTGIGESENYRQYNVKVIEDGFHHRMLGFVVGMSRVVADCQQHLISGKGPCAIPITDRRAHDLYCYAYGYVGPDRNVCESKYWKPPTGPS